MDRRTKMRRSGPAIWLALGVLVGACGGEISLTDYVDEVNAVLDRGMERYETLLATRQGEVLIAEGEQLLEFTPQDLHAALEQLADIQTEALSAAEAIEAPDNVAEFHRLFFRSLPIEELAARAGTAASWEELSDSVEMNTYRARLAEDRLVCDDFQARLDATAERGVFADVPWMPSELTEIAEMSLGCSTLPEHPEEMYRPPPSSP